MSFTSHYPVILLPEKIEANLVKQPSRSRSQEKEQKEIISVKPPAALIKPLRINWLVKAVRFLGWGFTGVVAFSFLASLLQDNSPLEYLSGLILLLLTILVVITAIDWAKRLKRAVNADSLEHENKRWRDNKKHNQNYHRQCRRLLQQQFRQANPNLQLNPYRQKEPLHKHTFERGISKAEAPKGVSEQYFLGFLRKYFPDCELTTDYFALNAKIGYTTDFSLITADQKLGIDIEIDEPYEGKNKTPHHCTDNNKDRNRNHYLLEKGWVVIRLSEYQVVHYPQSCCHLIAELLAKLGYDSYLLALTNVMALPKDTTWSSVTVKPMIARKYRELYLDKAGLFRYDPDREKRNAKQRRRKNKKTSKPKYRLKLSKKV